MDGGILSRFILAVERLGNLDASASTSARSQVFSSLNLPIVALPTGKFRISYDLMCLSAFHYEIVSEFSLSNLEISVSPLLHYIDVAELNLNYVFNFLVDLLSESLKVSL